MPRFTKATALQGILFAGEYHHSGNDSRGFLDMPAALDVDREQVRMLVLSIGVREAARKLDLPEATVQAWSARGKWLAHVTNPTPIRKPESMVPATSATKAPVDALAEVLAESNRETKIGYARAIAKHAKHVETLEPEKIGEKAGEIRDMVNSAAKVHGWEQGTASGVNVDLSFLVVQSQ